MRRCAFTLIELLVVVAIIALLISILVPSLQRARDQSRGTVCLSNLHSLSVAVVMYTDANNGRFPTAGYNHGSGDVEENAWLNQMKAETGDNRNVARCPADKSVHWTQPDTSNRLRRTSYASNFYTIENPRVDNRPAFDRVGRIPRPAQTIFWVELASESPTGFAAADHVHPENWFTNPRVLAGQEIDLERHLKRANYGLLDGHAAPFKFEQTYEIDYPHTVFPNIAWLANKYDPDIAR